MVLVFVQVGVFLVFLVFVQVGVYGVLEVGFLQLDIGGLLSTISKPVEKLNINSNLNRKTKALLFLLLL